MRRRWTARAAERSARTADAAGQQRVPVVYSTAYDVRFFGLEHLHAFDVNRHRHAYAYLRRTGVLPDDRSHYEPTAAVSEDDLVAKGIMTASYAASLRSSTTLARILEMFPLALFPNGVLQRRILQPMRMACAGSVLAATLALRYGWAVNLGGGYHHASRDAGGGFCVYPDVTLVVRAMREQGAHECRRIMIVDLDAHQGNGHERDHADDTDVCIVDVYNRDIYPQDERARLAIHVDGAIPTGTDTGRYLAAVRGALDAAFRRFPQPHLGIYVAGSDILDSDPLGQLAVSPDGLVERDELVCRAFRDRGVPIVMLLAGGYLCGAGDVVGRSVQNLVATFGLQWCSSTDDCTAPSE